MRIACTVIDSGGHFTQQVYNFTRTRRGRRIYAIKGKSGQGRPIVSRPSTSNKGKVLLFTIGVDTAKELVAARLRIQEHGSGYCHYPINEKFDQEFFAQLTAEERRIKYIQGRPVPEWHSLRKRNEAFDLSVYCLAAVDIINPNYKSLADSMYEKSSEPSEPPKVNKPKIKTKTRFI